MTVLLTLAGGAICVVGLTQQDTAVYLWIPGLLLLTLAFRRTLRPPRDPRPGYIINPKDDHERHD